MFVCEVVFYSNSINPSVCKPEYCSFLKLFFLLTGCFLVFISFAAIVVTLNFAKLFISMAFIKGEEQYIPEDKMYCVYTGICKYLVTRINWKFSVSDVWKFRICTTFLGRTSFMVGRPVAAIHWIKYLQQLLKEYMVSDSFCI